MAVKCPNFTGIWIIFHIDRCLYCNYIQQEILYCGHCLAFYS